MLFSNTASSYSLDYKADKNFCGEGFVSKEEEKAGFFVDVYIEDAADGLEDSFDVDFFNNLPTPVEEVKPWFLTKQFNAFEKPIDNIIPESVNGVSRSSVMDFGKFQDLTTFVNKQNTQTAMVVEDSLSTPVIDPNSTMLMNGPFFNATQTSDELTSGTPDDICGSFTIVPVTTSLPSSTQSLNVNNNVSSFSSSLRSLIGNDNTYSNFSSFTQTSLDNTHQMVTSSAPISYTPSTYSFPTPSSTRSCTPSLTPSVTPSSSSSSLTYHELKPRPQSLEASDLMMPTVINDHLYYSKSSASGQAPSPCPSTSSMTSSSTIDTKDFKRLSLDYEDEDQPKNSALRKKNNEASRKSRMTKKQKYDDMVSQEKELTRQNTEMKAKVHELEAITKHLRNYLMDIMKKGANK